MDEYKDSYTITVGCNNMSLTRDNALIYNVSRYYDPGFSWLIYIYIYIYIYTYIINNEL